MAGGASRGGACPQRSSGCPPPRPTPPAAACSYVVGDSRFQRYCKSNPRKMVKVRGERWHARGRWAGCREGAEGSRCMRLAHAPHPPPSPPRQMWAEKEMRNLARLHAAGILCPKPLQLRLHVLGACVCLPLGPGWPGLAWARGWSALSSQARRRQQPRLCSSSTRQNLP